MSSRGSTVRPPGAGGGAEARGPDEAAEGESASAAADDGGGTGTDATDAAGTPDAGPAARGGGLRLTLSRIRRLLGGIPAFGRLLYRLLGDRRVSLLDKAIFGAALVYLFVPLDLVPDWVPALGQMDDLLVVLFTLDRLLHRTDEAVLAENWDGDAEALDALRGLLERAAGVLPGWARHLLRAG